MVQLQLEKEMCNFVNLLTYLWPSDTVQRTLAVPWSRNLIKNICLNDNVCCSWTMVIWPLMMQFFPVYCIFVLVYWVVFVEEPLSTRADFNTLTFEVTSWDLFISVVSGYEVAPWLEASTLLQSEVGTHGIFCVLAINDQAMPQPAHDKLLIVFIYAACIYIVNWFFFPFSYT